MKLRGLLLWSFLIAGAHCSKSSNAFGQPKLKVQLPSEMRFCGANCFLLIFTEDHYVAYKENGGIVSDTPGSTYIVVSFTRDSVILDRHDGNTRSQVTGRMSDRGNSILDGRIHWLNAYNNQTFGCQLTWGSALSTAQITPPVPLGPAPDNAASEAHVASQPLRQRSASESSAPDGYRFFHYPGTNFPTQLTSINDKGVAVGFFTIPFRADATCDPGAFGGPCPPPNREGEMVSVPYAFSYANGKFTRLIGTLAGVSNNRPIAINNHGQVLIQHGKFPNMPMSVGSDYLLYDLATGAIRKVERGGGNLDSVSFGLFTVFGINDKGEVGGVAMVTRVIEPSKPLPKGMFPAQLGTLYGPPKISQGYGIAVGAPATTLVGHEASDKPVSFTQIQVSLSACANENLVRAELAGPNNNGQIAVSCGTEGVVYDVAAHHGAPFSHGDIGISVKAIGNDGSIVGCSGNRGFLYQSSRFSFLPLPDGNGIPGAQPGACALGINASSQMVGFASDTAFIYTPAH